MTLFYKAHIPSGERGYMVQVTSHRVKQNMHKDIQKCDHFGFGNRKAAKVSCMKQKIYLCSPWGFSSLVRTFLSLVLWAAGSQFSCFSQRCTDSQVRLQTLNQCGLGRSFSLRICTWIWLHTHTHLHSLHAAAAADGREVWSCWQCLPPLSSLCCLSVTFLDWIQQVCPRNSIFDTLWLSGFLFFLGAPMLSDATDTPCAKSAVMCAAMITFEWHTFIAVNK